MHNPLRIRGHYIALSIAKCFLPGALWPRHFERAGRASCGSIQISLPDSPGRASMAERRMPYEVLDEVDHLWAINERAGACGSIGT